MNRAVIRINTEKVMETARPTSISHFGSGRMRMTRMATTPKAMAMSLRRMTALKRSRI